jgi:hypothetical protein
MVDIFSLGCVYYYMLTRGKHPFGENFHRQVSTIFMLLLGLCLLLHALKGQESFWGELPQTGKHNIHASPWAVSTTTCSQGAGILLGRTSTDR